VTRTIHDARFVALLGVASGRLEILATAEAPLHQGLATLELRMTAICD
jgi:hypothetical protein